MPLNTFNDAVGPMTKTVRELAMVLDQVTGVDPEDEATREAAAHGGRSFAATLDGASLRGKRIAVLRQLFVGVTGEREVAVSMDRVIRELRAAGATVVEAAIPDLDEHYRDARGSAPGSLKAGWTAYLSRGAASGDRVLTVQDLIASGQMAPAGTRRLQDALRTSADGEAGRAAVDSFLAGRERFREHFDSLMDRERVDALLYPANQARPHTHEGGLERYGGEPGTCEPSAMTGLPQVTVPAGFIGGRYPFGVSFLGRLWSDRELLAVAYAYEQATHHRRAPGAAK
jgi:Asp-tRNA(Asn)/Glu-tRNA(Gln) amidotransferase A subunit family amidase